MPVSEKITYGKRDVQVLIDTLLTHHFSFYATLARILIKNKGPLREQVVGLGPFLDDERNFLFRTEFKDVPKFVGSKGLEIFVEWRLKIGK